VILALSPCLVYVESVHVVHSGLRTIAHCSVLSPLLLVSSLYSSICYSVRYVASHSSVSNPMQSPFSKTAVLLNGDCIAVLSCSHFQITTRDFVRINSK